MCYVKRETHWYACYLGQVNTNHLSMEICKYLLDLKNTTLGDSKFTVFFCILKTLNDKIICIS